MTHTDDLVQIENVVASTGIGRELDLAVLAEDLPGTEYCPSQFPGLVYRTQERKAAALVFSSGKIVTTGAESTTAARDTLATLFEQLAGLGIAVPDDLDPTIQNIVSSADLGQQINLTGAAVGLSLENIEYEPEQFPGLVYRPPDLETVVLLFGSGKLVITGATCRKEALQTFETVREELVEVGLLE